MNTKQKFQAIYNTLDTLTVQGHFNIQTMANVMDFLESCIRDESAADANTQDVDNG